MGGDTRIVRKSRRRSPNALLAVVAVVGLGVGGVVSSLAATESDDGSALVPIVHVG